MRAVYFDVYDYGRCIGRYKAADIQTLIHCGRLIPPQYADTGKAYRGRYTFIRVEDYTGWGVKGLAGEWDRTRLHILRAGGCDADGKHQNNQKVIRPLPEDKTGDSSFGDGAE